MVTFILFVPKYEKIEVIKLDRSVMKATNNLSEKILEFDAYIPEDADIFSPSRELIDEAFNVLVKFWDNEIGEDVAIERFDNLIKKASVIFA